jgi:hypothetical protein
MDRTPIRRSLVKRSLDAGGATLEYVALGVLAAVIIGALATSLSDAPVKGAKAVICRVLQQRDCAAFGGGTDPGGTPSDDGGSKPSTPKTAEDYQRLLCTQLQLDCANWDTSRGLSCNDDRVQKVYAYYQGLFDRNSDLQWAGMAKLAGSTVYGGLQDIHILRSLTKDERLRWLAKYASGLPKELIDQLANAVGNEFDFYETKLVEMQKRIFLDLGWQHAAYERGGVREMRRLAAAGQLTPQLASAWEDIDSGDPERVKRGNTALLYREQHDILQPFYDQMKAHQPLGLAVTYLIGVTADSPVPGGKPFRDVVNDVHLPLGINVPVPVPTGNIATFDSRWKWISEDMLPTYTALLKNDPRSIRNTIDTPLTDRAKEFRIIPNWLVPYNPKDGVC